MTFLMNLIERKTCLSKKSIPTLRRSQQPFRNPFSSGSLRSWRHHDQYC